MSSCSASLPSRCPSRPWVRAILLCALLSSGMQAVAAPLVAVSIRPLQHIASAITDGISTVQLAVAPNQDPHHLSLKPSERQLLEDAAVVLWVGASLELPLEKLVTQLPGTVLTVQAIDGVSLIESGHGDAHAGVDPHLWLDTRHAALLAAALAQELVRLDPANAAAYAANLATFERELQATEAALSATLAPLRKSAWAVEHHAFRYLERQFALTPALQLRDSDNREAGVRSVRSLLQAMRAVDLHCIVAEPQVAAAPLRSLLGDPDLRVASIDILGHDIEPAADAYVRMMLGIAEALAACRGSGA